MAKNALLAALLSIMLLAAPHTASAQDADVVDESEVPFGIWGFIAPTTTFCFDNKLDPACYSRSSQLYCGYRVGVTLQGPADEHSRWLMPVSFGYFREYNMLQSARFVGDSENQAKLSCAGFDRKFSGAFISLSSPIGYGFCFAMTLRGGIYGDWKHRLEKSRKGGAGTISISYPKLFKRFGSRYGIVIEPSVGVGLYNYNFCAETGIIFRPHIGPK